MSKKSRKLSLKKETLRSLDRRHLAQVAGGTFAYYGDQVALKSLTTVSGSNCTTGGGLVLDYQWYFLY